MRSSIRPYIFSVFFSMVLLGCHSKTEPLNAGPRFHDEPGKLALNTLAYEDTTLPEFQNIIKRLDSFYNIQVRAGFNGSVLIGQKGKIIYERYFGYGNRESGYKLQSNSSSQLASTSKTFTGAAILYLHQHNYLNIDEPVKDYLPSFPFPNITIKMLLNHRSGLPDYLKWVPKYRKNQAIPITNHEVLQLFARFKPGLEFKPNTRFKYSNSNYALLASVIEQVTEMKYSDFMTRYIFEPLGMNNTFIYDPSTGLPSNAAISYKYNWRREPDMFADGVYGDKGIYSTVRDLYRWDQSFYNNRLLSNEMLQLAYTPYSFERPGTKNYGLGWRMLNFPNGNQVIYHNGWWHGNNTVFYRFVRENMTIIVLGNKYNSNIYRQAKVVYSLVKNVPVNEGFEGDE